MKEELGLKIRVNKFLAQKNFPKLHKKTKWYLCSPLTNDIKPGDDLAEAKFVQKQLKNDITSHDWWYSKRVRDMALKIAKKEKDIDLLVVELAALLHDLVDWKLADTNDKKVVQWLRKIKISEERINNIMKIIKNLSFKEAGVRSKLSTKERMIVQETFFLVSLNKRLYRRGKREIGLI